MPVDAPAASPPGPAAGPDPLLRRVEELEALRRLALELSARVDPDEVFARLAAALPGLLGADVAALADPSSPAPRTWAAGGAAAPVPAAWAGALSAGETRVLQGGGGAPSGVVVPLPAGALLVGWSDGRTVEPEAARLAEALAETAAAALVNAARYAEMQAAAVRRERFFSAMSHDLRTPITAIVGYSELLQDGIVGELTDRQQEMVDRICQVSSQLSQLVNDIMDLAKLDAGRLEFHLERVSLGDLVEEAIVTVAPQAASKGLVLRRELGEAGGRAFRLDRSRVRQILVNLLSNAVKFTDAGEVMVAAWSEEGRAWIEVRDTGPGLPAGSEEAVFEEFLQIASGTRVKRQPGSGLGLAISRRLARAMGGALAARSREGGGAAFTLLLPPSPAD